MQEHVLEREQVVGGDPGEIWEFFADALNLEAITPGFLRFRVISPQPVRMGVGTLIEYRLRFRGVPVSWLTRIEEWEPGRRFVDRQLRGPYALWHHTHTFEPHPSGGTLVRDRVRYGIPLGPLGEIARWLFVGRDVERIFDFRREEIARRFGTLGP